MSYLPKDYVGERHVVIVGEGPSVSLPAGTYQFEERPGPAPPGSDDGVPRLIMTWAELNS